MQLPYDFPPLVVLPLLDLPPAVLHSFSDPVQAVLEQNLQMVPDIPLPSK
jgi:hypothetical protein